MSVYPAKNSYPKSLTFTKRLFVTCTSIANITTSSHCLSQCVLFLLGLQRHKMLECILPTAIFFQLKETSKWGWITWFLVKNGERSFEGKWVALRLPHGDMLSSLVSFAEIDIALCRRAFFEFHESSLANNSAVKWYSSGHQRKGFKKPDSW